MNKFLVRVAPIIALSSIVAASQAGLLYVQPFDGSGNALASQNDTNGQGNFATTYDNFTLGGTSNVNEVAWVGEYFNPAQQANITAWTVNFYGDNAGTPGGLLASYGFAGTGGETSMGSFGGYPTFSYDVALSSAFTAVGGTQYWLSVVPDLGFPPQWGWSTGTGGDGAAYQVFYGSGYATSGDQAFALSGTPSGTPEPFTMSIGLAGAALAFRRRMIAKKS